MPTVRILRGVDNQVVEAILLGLTQKHVEDFAIQWQTPLTQATQEDKFWDWAFKHRITSTRDNYEGYAIECDGATQGLMMLETQQHRTQFRPGQPLIYVSALSVAPWNRQQIQRPPRFRTVGTALLEFASRRSTDLG